MAQYTSAQLRALTPEQRGALQFVTYRLDPNNTNLDEMNDGALTEIFNLFRPCDFGSVPEEEIGDGGIYETIHRKASSLLHAAVDLATEAIGPGALPLFWVVIDPDVENYTRSLVVDYDRRLPWCYFNENETVWTIEYPTLAAIADDVRSKAFEIVDRYRLCAKVSSLWRQDLYTDAHEYSERVAELRNAIRDLEAGPDAG